MENRSEHENPGYRLLVILMAKGCPACHNFIDKYEDTLKELVIEQNLVSISRVPFVHHGNEDVLLQKSKGGTNYVHPQLSSYVMGYPSFILVNDATYKNPKSDLEVIVFNRVVKDGKYTFGSTPYTPMNILSWVEATMAQLDEAESKNTHDQPGEGVNDDYDRFSDIIRDRDLFCERNRTFCNTIV